MIVTKGMYDKEFKFNNNGKEESIIIKPLTTKYLPKLFKIVKALDIKGMKQYELLSTDSEDVKTKKQLEANDVIFQRLSNEDTMKDLIDVVTATVQKAYPNMDTDTIDEFVSANMFTVLPFIFEVNFKK